MYNVLEIDDEKFILELLQEILARFGYHVETATGGQEGSAFKPF
jgi:CheY-like chemotaxis protein